MGKKSGSDRTDRTNFFQFPLLLFYVVILFVGGRAFTVFYREYTTTKYDVGYANTADASCTAIDKNIAIVDEKLRTGIIQLCGERRSTASRYVVIEALNRFIEKMWICETFHCSEYVIPVMDYFANAAKYSILIGIAIIFLFLYFLLPALLGIMIRAFTPKWLREEKQESRYVKEFACPIGSGNENGRLQIQ